MQTIRHPSSEDGQTIVIFVLAMLAVIGLIALVIDGGYLYWQRRVAQNAADAGALAGAAILCSPQYASYSESEKISLAKTVTAAYVTNNSAQAASEDIKVSSTSASQEGQPDLLSLNTVEVKSTVEFQTFFGGAIGINTLSTSAAAKALCAPAAFSEGPLPVSWTCKAAPAGGDDTECVIDYQLGPACNFGSGPYYIFVDVHSDSHLGMSCALPSDAGNPPPGTIDCSAVGVHVIENEVNGYWLDLTGTGAGSNTSAWTQDGFYGYPGYLSIHTWYPEITGDFDEVFTAIQEKRSDQVVSIPVYDRVYPGNPYLNSDAGWHNGQDFISGDRNSNVPHVHIGSLASFQVNCVYAGEGSSCEGTNWLLNQVHDGDHDNELRSRIHAVEGCFTYAPVQGPRGAAGAAGDTGAYSVTLVK